MTSVSHPALGKPERPLRPARAYQPTYEVIAGLLGNRWFTTPPPPGCVELQVWDPLDRVDTYWLVPRSVYRTPMNRLLQRGLGVRPYKEGT